METLTFDFRMLWPIFAIVGLTFLSGIYLAKIRVDGVKEGKTRLSFYRIYRNGEEPEKTAVATRHFTNLFETPVLFYLGCLIAGILGPAPTIAFAAAWLFAAFRVTQSLIHLTTNNILHRASAFWISSVPLLALWVSNVVALAART